MDAVAKALPFAADACLVASSFEADADDADDAAELADDAAAVLRILRWFPTLSRSFPDVFAAEADLAAALACSVASPAFVVAVEADDAALSADFPAAVALAEACPALVDAALADDAAAVLSLPQLRRSVPLPSQKTRVRLGRFAAFAELPAAVAEEAALLALEAARSFLMILPPLLKPTHPG